MQAAPNAAQIAYWNESAGARWARLCDRIDATFEPVTRAALESAAPRVGETVLDIGCGCGATTFALAQRAGSAAAVVGVDVSEPMLAVANARAQAFGAGNARFVLGDAALHSFETAATDLVFSRFGVMFFDDPVSAFANIRRAMRPAGRLSFVCWRTLGDSAFFSVPLAATLPLIEAQSPADPDAPGPLAFAKPERIRHVLETAGYGNIRIEPLDATLPIAGTPPDAAAFLMSVGPVSRLIANRDGATLATIRDALATALVSHKTPRGIELSAGVWLVSASSASER